MKMSPLLTVAMLLACMLTFTGPARADDAPKPADLKIAICNPLTVAQKIQESKDIAEKAKADKKSLESTAAEKQEKLKAMQAELQLLIPDSPQFAEKNQSLLQASIEYEVWQKMSDLDLARKSKNSVRGLFDKIQSMTAQIAQAKGITLVIADRHIDLPDNIDNMDQNTLEQLIMQRTVLYNDTKLDITQEVIVKMDEAYNAKH
jgi:Skp family chaperone for outer membrane proteins